MARGAPQYLFVMHDALGWRSFVSNFTSAFDDLVGAPVRRLLIRPELACSYRLIQAPDVSRMHCPRVA